MHLASQFVALKAFFFVFMFLSLALVSCLARSRRTTSYLKRVRGSPLASAACGFLWGFASAACMQGLVCTCMHACAAEALHACTLGAVDASRCSGARCWMCACRIGLLQWASVCAALWVDRGFLSFSWRGTRLQTRVTKAASGRQSQVYLHPAACSLREERRPFLSAAVDGK